MKFSVLSAVTTGALVASLAQSAYIPPNNGPVTYTYDDASPDVRYSVPEGSWTHLKNQGYGLYDKTESYAGKNGQVILDNPTGTGSVKKFNLKVYSTKKSDRGLFNVYCGHALVGSGNEYSAGGETNTQVVFDKNFTCGDIFVIKNDRGAKYMAFDRADITYLPN